MGCDGCNAQMCTEYDAISDAVSVRAKTDGHPTTLMLRAAGVSGAAAKSYPCDWRPSLKAAMTTATFACIARSRSLVLETM